MPVEMKLYFGIPDPKNVFFSWWWLESWSQPQTQKRLQEQQLETNGHVETLEVREFYEFRVGWVERNQSTSSGNPRDSTGMVYVHELYTYNLQALNYPNGSKHLYKYSPSVWLEDGDWISRD